MALYGSSLVCARLVRRVVAGAVVVLATGCAAEPLVFPDWTIPVPEDTPVREYAAVALQERTERLGFERDLVITEAFGRGLYRPGDVTVADDGRIYVLDNGNFRIVAFDADGEPLFEAGREGQGPGEMQLPIGFGLDGANVLFSDYRNARLTVYGPDGALVADHALSDPWWAVHLLGIDAGLVTIVARPIAMGAVDRPQPLIPWKVGVFSVEGVERTPLIELAASNKAYLGTGSLIGRLPMVVANPRGAIAPDGTVYATAADEYQVLAIAPSGEKRWALRTNWTPEVLAESQKREILAALTIPEPDLAGAEYVWPQRFAAIESLEVDGDGNLYVFPYSYRAPNTPADSGHPVAVDVYSPAGDVLFRGLSPLDSWNAAHDDQVFRIEDDPDSGERIVVRYRMMKTLH